MSKRQSAWLAWALCAIGIVLALASLILTTQMAGGLPVPSAMGEGVLSALIAIAYGVVGALVVSRQPHNLIGWLLLVVGASFAFGTAVLEPWSLSLPATAELTPTTLLLAWLSGVSWWLLVGPLLLIPLVFPTGRLLSSRWKWVVVLLAASLAAFLLSVTFPITFTLPNATEPARNPLGFLPEAVAQILFVLFQVLLPAAAVGSVAAIFVRYRRAGPVERQQLKWFLYACALFVMAFVLQFFYNSNTSGTSGSVSVIDVLFGLAIPSIPIAIGVAILRYRLWDIDVIIRRTLVYAVLTGLLALAYFGSVVVLQNLFGALTGQRESPLVTVLSTLIIAALFVPVRRRVQAFIDRRFYRRKYDAARTLAAFGASLREHVEIDGLSERLLEVVHETMEPASASLWLSAEISERAPLGEAPTAETQLKPNFPGAVL